MSGDKLEEHGKQPATVHMFVKIDRQKTGLYAAVYGEEHLNERLNAIDRLGELHEECPEFFTLSLISEMWERMTYQYTSCVTGGIHYFLAKYDEGITFAKIKRYALVPDGSGGTAWRFAPIFDFNIDDGFWGSVIIHEIRQERQLQDIRNLVAERSRTPRGKNRKSGDRVGGR